MALKTKVVRDGHSWAVRLPKVARELSGIKPGDTVELSVKPGRIIIKMPAKTQAQRKAYDDQYEQARLDMKTAWDEAFEEIWLRTVGLDE